jgi:hypothetical protein
MMPEFFKACLHGKRPWPSKVRIKFQQYVMNGEWKDLNDYTDAFFTVKDVPKDRKRWRTKKLVKVVLEKTARVRIKVVSERGTVIRYKELLYVIEVGDSVEIQNYDVVFTYP